MSGREELNAARARRSRPAGADVRASRLSGVAEAIPVDPAALDHMTGGDEPYDDLYIA